MTIQVEDNTILLGLKRILKAMDGVTIVSSRKKTITDQDRLNATTIKAIKDVKAGKTHKASSVDDLVTLPQTGC